MKCSLLFSVRCEDYILVTNAKGKVRIYKAHATASNQPQRNLETFHQENYNSFIAGFQHSSVYIKPRVLIVVLLIFISTPIRLLAQQYNSDSWVSKPHGTVTIIPTIGQRNTMIMNTFSLFPRWEFTIALYAYNDDNDPATDDGHSSSLYAKYMFYENANATGGASVKAGTGMFPGTINPENRTNDAFQTFWVNFPCTVPFFNNKLSWDIMPGASLTRHTNEEKENALAFTYSTRLAYYPFNLEWAVVGEVFGTEGQLTTIPEYKIGVRWEPTQSSTFALTYGQEFNGVNGAGFEFGVMLFSPRFACFGGCDKTKKKNQVTRL